jgi:hypothetical protein
MAWLLFHFRRAQLTSSTSVIGTSYRERESGSARISLKRVKNMVASSRRDDQPSSVLTDLFGTLPGLLSGRFDGVPFCLIWRSLAYRPHLFLTSMMFRLSLLMTCVCVQSSWTLRSCSSLNMYLKFKPSPVPGYSRGPLRAAIIKVGCRGQPSAASS